MARSAAARRGDRLNRLDLTRMGVPSLQIVPSPQGNGTGGQLRVEIGEEVNVPALPALMDVSEDLVRLQCWVGVPLVADASRQIT